MNLFNMRIETSGKPPLAEYKESPIFSEIIFQIRNLDGVRLLWSLLKNPNDNVQVAITTNNYVSI